MSPTQPSSSRLTSQPSFSALSMAAPLRLEFCGRASALYQGQPLKLRQRSCDLLFLLASRPDGIHGSELSAALYGDWSDSQNHGVEMHRLGKQVPVCSRPYRLNTFVTSDFLEVQEHLAHGRLLDAIWLYRGELLPRSDSPAVAEWREILHEGVRGALRKSNHLEALWQFTRQFPDDLEMLELLVARMDESDSRWPIVAAHANVLLRKMMAV